MKNKIRIATVLFITSIGLNSAFADGYSSDYYPTYSSSFSGGSGYSGGGSGYYGNYGSYGSYGGFGSSGHRQFSVTSMNSDRSEQLGSSLRIAVREERTKDVLNLLADRNININEASDEGITALMYSSRNCSVEITKKLISAGADINAQDYKGRTPLMYAIQENCKPVSILLCQNSRLNLNLKDERGRTAQDYASAESASDIEGSASEIHQFLQKTALDHKIHIKRRQSS